MHQHLGAEYFNIGQAIADGRGFSDPFGEATGPTAWMPPLFPIIIAAALKVTGSRLSTSYIVLALSCVSYLTTVLILYYVASLTLRRVLRLLVVPLYLSWIVVFGDWFFLLTQDVWLIALGVALLLSFVVRAIVQRRAAVVPWGLLGGYATLTSPALALAWTFALCALPRPVIHGRARAMALAIALAIAAPWIVRNGLVFHAFIPVKSNLWFDAYQANVVDDDGVYDAATMRRHPFSDPVARFHYAEQGEARFAQHYRALVADSLHREPSAWTRKVFARLRAATFQYVPVDTEPRMWGVAHQVAYGVPLGAAMLVLFAGADRRALALRMFGICAVYLTPYVAVAFYSRYWLPLTPMFVFFILLAIERMADGLPSFARSMRWAGSRAL